MDVLRNTGTIRVPITTTQRDIERAFDGSILTLPFIPAFFALLLSVTSSVIYNVTDIDACSQELKIFVLVNIGYSYVFIMSYGFILVGPKMEHIIGTLLIYLIYFVLQLALMLFGSWQIYTEWNNSTACVRDNYAELNFVVSLSELNDSFVSQYLSNTPLFWIALVSVGIFWAMLVSFLLLFTIYGLKRCCRGRANLDMPQELDISKPVEANSAPLSVQSEIPNGHVELASPQHKKHRVRIAEHDVDQNQHVDDKPALISSQSEPNQLPAIPGTSADDNFEI
jgi:hypothetical protein